MDSQPSTGPEARPGVLRRVWNRIEQFLEADRKKWGGMTPGAMSRLGLAELREAASFGGNVAQPTPLGMYGTLTPGEVGDARDADPGARLMEEESRPSPGQIAEGMVQGQGQDPPLSRGRGM